jgi:anaerobic ribonucleoside-triphosphate reductase activating protein
VIAANLNLHAIERRSRANGPGIRTVVWVQGCDLGCPGCFNPETHANSERDRVAIDGLVSQLGADAAAGAIEGLTISGGEPLQQPASVLALVSSVRDSTDLSIVVFSGYSLDEIRAMELGPQILDSIDVLIDGRYRSGERVGRDLRGSDNQTIHCLTDRYTVEQVEATPEAEIRIDPSGNVVLTGVDPLILK